MAEGIFPSLYKNYGVPEGVTPPDIEILPESKPAMIFIAGDGDLIRNEVQVTPEGNIPMPLGYDRDTRQTLATKSL